MITIFSKELNLPENKKLIGLFIIGLMMNLFIFIFIWLIYYFLWQIEQNFLFYIWCFLFWFLWIYLWNKILINTKFI